MTSVVWLSVLFKTKLKSSMNLQDRASFYQKLHMGMKSGLTLRQVVDAQLLPSSSAEAGVILQRELDKGSSIAKAFTAASLVTPWEAELIHIGETSGRLEAVLARLDEFCSAKVAQYSHIKGKLVTPMLTLIAAIILLPIPAVANGSLTLIAYSVQAGISLLLIRFFFRALLLKSFERAEIGAFNAWLMRSLRFVGDEHFLRQLFEVSYLDLLTLCLESGMDAVNALKLMQRCFPNKKFRQQHAFAISKISKSGASLSETLNQFEILKSVEVNSFLVASEASGTLHSAMRDFIQRKQQEMDATVNKLLQRLAGAIYAAVLVYAVFRILPLLMVAVMPSI